MTLLICLCSPEKSDINFLTIYGQRASLHLLVFIFRHMTEVRWLNLPRSGLFVQEPNATQEGITNQIACGCKPSFIYLCVKTVNTTHVFTGPTMYIYTIQYTPTVTNKFWKGAHFLRFLNVFWNCVSFWK